MNVKHLCSFLLIALIGSLAIAASLDDQIDALQKEFKARYPELRELKDKGVIGETSNGFVAFVKSEDAGSADVMNAENSDRTRLYQLVAEKEKTTPEKVAERNARRNFREARKGDYLRDKNGNWRQQK
jgi:uncharacterized protein YdbL (DUF1318 family)